MTTVNAFWIICSPSKSSETKTASLAVLSFKAGSLPMAEVLKWLTDAAENNTKIDLGCSCVTPFGIGTVQEHK